MFWFRLKHTIALLFIRSAIDRAEYLKKHKVLHHVGENCMVMFRKIPLYPQLISLGNNVWIASNVTFVTHDVIHYMLNNSQSGYKFGEHIGCIDIKDNVFIGANTTILSNVKIGSNVIIGAGSVVNKDLRDNGVYAGVPAKYICSLDEFVEKRRKEETVINGRLSEKDVEKCWQTFHKEH